MKDRSTLAKPAAQSTAKREFTHLAEIPAVSPLTESQRGVYLECIESPESVKYNIPFFCRLPAGTDPARLKEAVKTVVRAHPALQFTVSAPGGVPSMLRGEFSIEIPEKEVPDFREESLSFLRPFDLERGPLYRFELLHTPEGLILLSDIHHLVFDGTSLSAFVRQLACVYDGGECEEEGITLFDVAAAEALPGDPEKLKRDEEYYRQKFEGADCDCLPLPDQLCEEAGVGTGILISDAGEGLTPEVVGAFVREHHITETALFTAAFGCALAKCNGTQNFYFTTAYTGRTDPRLSSTVGMFVRTLPICYRFEEEKTTDTFLREFCDDYYRLRESDSLSFGDLAQRYSLTMGASFIFQSDLFKDLPIGSGVIHTELIDPGEGVVDFELMLLKTPQGYRLRSQYPNALYTEGFVRQFQHLFLCAVYGLMGAKTLRGIEWVNAGDRALLDSFNATEAPYEAEKTVIDLFREQVSKTPDKTCLVFRDKRYTYREADEISDLLARYLKKNGVGREQVVGILIPRCEYMLLGALGVLKAGGAYLPLDPSYPPERLNLMMRDSGAMMLLYDPTLSDVITREFTGKRMSVEEIPSLPDSDEPLPAPAPEDLFVMLYTSGSTGTPKGVMFRHSNTMVTAVWVRKYFEMGEASRVTAYASYGFDAHAFDLYPAVISGAELHIIPEELRLDFPALKKYFNDKGITHTVMTTQIGRQFALMGPFTSLRHLSVAGEKLTPPEVPDSFAMYNLYGPTEGSIITSAFRIDRRYKDVPIGTAVDNLKTYVVDKNGHLLPPGAVGELWIAGAHVTPGYKNRPEKTAEAYGDNPFPHPAGYERVYRTGDIVRMLPDGNLQFVGRRDAQVKVRGFRVELTEIEEVIRRFPGIGDATVAAFDEPSGGKYVAAYVVSDAPVDTAALAEFIRAEKPPYMVPAVTMQIDAIPLNQNQKVNRKALPVPERKIGEIVAPENETQRKIFDLIAEVVGHREFGVDTDLYEAGLTSIGAVRLNVVLAEAFDAPMRIADLKANNTVRRLEAFLLNAAAQTAYAVQEDYPITQTQSGIFVECMANPGTTVYNIPLLLRLGEGLELDRLADAVKAAVNAHPYLKATLFTDEQGNVRIRRRDAAAVTVSVISCDELPAREALMRPFELLDAPLYRAAIYRTGQGDYLYLDCHHIVCDGTSEAVILRDIDRAYAGKALHAEEFSGFEAALEEEKLRQSDALPRAEEYWSRLLCDCESSLPQKAPEDAAGGAGFLRVTGGENADVIRAFCSDNGLTLNALFNAAFSLVLSRFTGRACVNYATIVNGRSDSRLAQAVTMLVRTIPVAAQPDADTRVTEFVRTLQTQLLDSMAQDACSFAELTAKYAVSADLMFAYQGEDFTFDTLCKKPAEMIEFLPETAKAPLAINVYLCGNRFSCTAEYRKDSYCEAMARSMIDALMTAVAEFCRVGTLREVSLLSQSAEALYARLNDRALPVEPGTFIDLFERCAVKTPAAPALTALGRTLTYDELNRQVNRMANTLLRLGLKREGIVGSVLERSCEIPMTQMAIMKAGGAFLSILPEYPDERIDYCLTDAGSPFVITTEEIRQSRPELFTAGRPYRTLTVEELLREPNEENPHTEILPDQLAYCIYTSGSTGKPKGVMIEHHNLVNTIAAQWKILPYYHKENAGAALCSCSVSFDASVMEIYLPLSCGRHLVLSSDEEHMNPLAMRDLILRENIEMMISTPSYLSNLTSIPELKEAFAHISSIIVGAEAFPRTLYESLRAASGEMRIVNEYGPSECTVACSYKVLESPDKITIGVPTANMQLFVMDPYGHVQPPYAVGELIICGDGVGRGYINLPEKTAATYFRFRDLPAYHSGDLVRLNADTEIEFGGRIDNQVKLRGFRVELDEIENVMTAFPAVKQSKVLVRNNGTEDYLAAFFTADEPVDLQELTAHMKSRLTYYMVPAVMMQLEQMPLTPNGKIDKNGFPEVQQTERRKSGRRAPKKSMEQRLCEIFANVLNLDEVYADDNFFELGGTSLSASKVTMVLMSDGIEVKYGDIFDNPTPEELSRFLETRDAPAAPQNTENETAVTGTTRETLRFNTVKYAAEVKRRELGNVLLTGAVGFLGIHILNELLQSEKGHIYCLVRRGSHETAEIRLKTMLIYYFSKGFDEELKNRITVLEADITDETLYDTLRDVPFDTVINCAACVKHFSDTDILEEINVHGVENLIGVCQKKNARLIQISTVSVPGIHTKESYEKQIRMHENELFVIDDMANKYGISKYHAELKMLDAIDNGLRGKIIRVGNLMGRHSDGEFQANMETNMFMSGIRGFAVMGKYPISHMTDPMRFSPVDCTARAVVLLAGTNDKFTAFNADNRYGFDEMKIIDACNRNGITILPEADEVYYAEFQKKLGDDQINARLGGLAAYDIKDAHAVDTDNLFTTNILYRIGFSWPLVDDSYLDRAIHSIMTLDYFELAEAQEDL